MADWSKFFDAVGDTVIGTFGTAPGSVGNKLRDAEIARGNVLAEKAKTLETRTIDALKTDHATHVGLHKEVLKKYLDALTNPPTTMDFPGTVGSGVEAPQIDLDELRNLYLQTYVSAEAKRAVWFDRAGIKFTPVSMNDMLGDLGGSGIDFEVLGEMVTDSLKAEEGGASILSYAEDIRAGKDVNLSGHIESIQDQIVDAQNAARVKERLPHMSDAEVELFLSKNFNEEAVAKLKQAIRNSIVNRLVSGGLTGSQRAPGDEYEQNLKKTIWGQERDDFQNLFPSPLNENPLYIEQGLAPQAAISPEQGMLTQRQMIAQAEQEAIQRQSNFPQWLEMLRRRAAA
mgnify:CR=1 FL=1|tara:strand:+ start:5415 stop:6443 length:1029 start_codon:yes stop_codon:yes gene_type:complete